MNSFSQATTQEPVKKPWWGDIKKTAALTDFFEEKVLLKALMADKVVRISDGKGKKNVQEQIR